MINSSDWLALKSGTQVIFVDNVIENVFPMSAFFFKPL